MTEERYRQDLQRSEHAKRLLNDELLVEAFSMIRQNCLREFENSKATDTEGREEVWKMLKALNELERHLKSILERGKLAKEQLSFLEKMRKKVTKV